MFNNTYNPYFMQQPMQRMQPVQPIQPVQPTQPIEQPIQQTPQPIYRQSLSLQGKSVDSLDVVKAMDIPLDGSISYFPLVDGSAIVTKQLQQDGTSKTIVYKPVEEEKLVETKKEEYVTIKQFNETIKDIQNKQSKEWKEEMKSLKREFRDLSDDLKDIKDKKGD